MADAHLPPRGSSPTDADSPVAAGGSSGNEQSTGNEESTGESRQSGPDVTLWLRGLESGDQEAATRLWAYCYPRLLRHARHRLPERMRRVLDEEDVALSAFKSLCLGAARGSFAEIGGRDELWRLLLCITSRKAQGYVRHENREKRGGGKVRGESIFLTGDSADGDAGIDQVPIGPPVAETPEDFARHCQDLFDALDDENLQAIAMLRMEGYRVDEIAERVGCARRSVERRLSLIRTIWLAERDPPT